MREINKSFLLPRVILVISSALWGASFIFTKGLFLSEQGADGEPIITPLIILTGRMFIATVVTMPLLLLTGKLQKIERRDLFWFILLAFFEPFLYSLCETGGVRLVSGSLASVIVATIPLFVPFGMALVYKERLRGGSIVGLLLSVLGVALMAGWDTDSLAAGTEGILLLVLAVFIAVCYTLMLVRFLKKYNPMTITAWQNFFGLLFFAPLMLIMDGDHLGDLSYSPRMWLSIAFLGVMCSTVAYMCFNYGMKRLGATTGSIYNNIIPIFSLLLALAMGQETLDWMKVAGMFVVILGLTVAQTVVPK